MSTCVKDMEIFTNLTIDIGLSTRRNFQSITTSENIHGDVRLTHDRTTLSNMLQNIGIIYLIQLLVM